VVISAESRRCFLRTSAKEASVPVPISRYYRPTRTNATSGHVCGSGTTNRTGERANQPTKPAQARTRDVGGRQATGVTWSRPWASSTTRERTVRACSNDAERLWQRIQQFIKMRLVHEGLDSEALELACYAMQLPARKSKTPARGGRCGRLWREPGRRSRGTARQHRGPGRR